VCSDYNCGWNAGYSLDDLQKGQAVMTPRLSDSQKEFLSQNHKLIFKGIRKISERRNMKLTEDEVSECVVKVLRQFPSHNPELSKESTYLYRNCDFALRKLGDDRRSANNKPKCLQCDSESEYDSEYIEDYKEPLNEDLKVDLADALLRLPTMWVDVLTRRIIHAETYPSISSSYGMSNSWSMGIVRSALLHLKMDLYHWRNDDATRPE
jgi:hypothetical protein